MKELLRRLSAQPLLTLELTIASLLANLLALASPLFVTQVLNRYVSSGVDATLITMTVGVIVAIGLEFGFRQARLRLAMSVGTKRDQALATGATGMLTTARAGALGVWSPAQRREILRGLGVIRSAYGAPNLVAVLDLPFTLLFLAVLTALSPPLGLIALLFVGTLLIFGLVGNHLTRKNVQRWNELQLHREMLTQQTCGPIDTIRVCGAAAWIRQRWQQLQETADKLQRRMENRQGVVQGVQGALQSLMSVAIIAVGARLAVAGELQVGTLIGANILAGRALGPILRLASLGELFIKAEQALTRLEQLAALPVESASGAILKEFRGGVEIKDLAKTLPPALLPVFESLSLVLPPGGVLAVRGDDGAGKTLLARMLVGLVAPDRGQILMDGVDASQLNPGWWRKQLIYLPRDVAFLDGTLRENLTLQDPDVTPEALHEAITDAGLGPWLDETPRGLETPLADGGGNLSPDLRKRLALARALIQRGRLAILDEPTENLTPKGILTLYALLHKLSRSGVTLIVCTEDPNILRGASLVLNLDHKPKPNLINRLTANPDPESTP
ncbi:MAG: ATP-binding cassette domain-containing protein [Magnetococcales bacterium]|nr:ATP-binding cassette domain-containing protein [Magnetococcales bacterium]